MATYQILTHDVLIDRMTPQEGVPEFVGGWAGLRRALRTLRGMSYEARRGDARISVTKTTHAAKPRKD